MQWPPRVDDTHQARVPVRRRGALGAAQEDQRRRERDGEGQGIGGCGGRAHRVPGPAYRGDRHDAAAHTEEGGHRADGCADGGRQGTRCVVGRPGRSGRAQEAGAQQQVDDGEGVLHEIAARAPLPFDVRIPVSADLAEFRRAYLAAPHTGVTNADWAARTAMSERAFTRRFRAQAGDSPAVWRAPHGCSRPSRCCARCR
ncbi:hypothetical protein GCM10010279_27660 [Streptomyces mutabilis]|nr:hypothetical protein GCM10010279_27660 [Streptomyces mutabilis]